MKQSATALKLSLIASYAVMAILVLVPFNALLYTWAGSNFRHLDLFRIGKELLMLPLGLYASLIVLNKPTFRQQFANSWLVRCILAYTLLFFVYAAVVLLRHSVVTSAVLYSLITNLRFIWWLLVVWVISLTNPLLQRQWLKIVLIPASLVIIFGLLQKFLLPADFLRHFGYGPNTIEAIETVDQKLDYRRIQSSLRGANPLGAYLIIVLTTIVAYVRKYWYLWILLAGGIVLLSFTYSRSALLGLAASLLFFGWQALPNRLLRRGMLFVAVAGALILGGLTWALRHNSIVENTVFHSDSSSQASTSSNAQRASALKQGWQDVSGQPLGSGPGTAGPASVRNNGQARLAENYFLQIGQEVGWLGVALFVAINLLVARSLWQRTTPLARVLLASLVGITLVNLLSHAWADDTISLLWWGLAGIGLSTPVILNSKHEQKTKTNQKTSTRTN